MIIKIKYLEPDERGRIHRIMTCDCGRHIDTQDHAPGSDIDCDCGRLYNSSGQEISYPYGDGSEEYWPEEF